MATRAAKPKSRNNRQGAKKFRKGLFPCSASTVGAWKTHSIQYENNSFSEFLGVLAVHSKLSVNVYGSCGLADLSPAAFTVAK